MNLIQASLGDYGRDPIIDIHWISSSEIFKLSPYNLTSEYIKINL